MWRKIQFENDVHERKGKGEYNGICGQKEENKPTKRIMTSVRHLMSPDEVEKRARKPAPAEVLPLRRDPICTGEQGRLVVPRDRVYSQIF